MDNLMIAVGLNSLLLPIFACVVFSKIRSNLEYFDTEICKLHRKLIDLEVQIKIAQESKR